MNMFRKLCGSSMGPQRVPGFPVKVSDLPAGIKLFSDPGAALMVADAAPSKMAAYCAEPRPELALFRMVQIQRAATGGFFAGTLDMFGQKPIPVEFEWREQGDAGNYFGQAFSAEGERSGKHWLPMQKASNPICKYAGMKPGGDRLHLASAVVFVDEADLERLDMLDVLPEDRRPIQGLVNQGMASYGLAEAEELKNDREYNRPENEAKQLYTIAADSFENAGFESQAGICWLKSAQSLVKDLRAKIKVRDNDVATTIARSAGLFSRAKDWDGLQMVVKFCEGTSELRTIQSRLPVWDKRVQQSISDNAAVYLVETYYTEPSDYEDVLPQVKQKISEILLDSAFQNDPELFVSQWKSLMNKREAGQDNIEAAACKFFVAWKSGGFLVDEGKPVISEWFLPKQRLQHGIRLEAEENGLEFLSQFGLKLRRLLLTVYGGISPAESVQCMKTIQEKFFSIIENSPRNTESVNQALKEWCKTNPCVEVPRTQEEVATAFMHDLCKTEFSYFQAFPWGPY